MSHVVAADRVGPVGEATRMFIISRSKQQCRRVHGSTGSDYDVSRVFFDRSIAFHHYSRDFAARRVCFQADNIGISDQRDVFVLECWIYTHYLRVGFGIHKTRLAVAGVTADAPAFTRVLLVQHDAKWHVKRLQACCFKIVRQMLNALFMSHRRVSVWRTGPRFRWVFTAVAVHLI